MEKNYNSKGKRLAVSGIALALISVLVLGVTSHVTAQYAVFSGYGYGECTAQGPKNLRATTSRGTVAAVLHWKKVKFSNCDSHKKPAYYVVKIAKKNGTVVKTYSGIKKLNKKVLKSELVGKRFYKFRVQAVATDGSLSNWSSYKLFKLKGSVK
jgi:hypothetical protein